MLIENNLSLMGATFPENVSSKTLHRVCSSSLHYNRFDRDYFKDLFAGPLVTHGFQVPGVRFDQI